MDRLTTALKLTNFDMLFLVMGFISLVDEIQFMLISSRHICIRSTLYQYPSNTNTNTNTQIYSIYMTQWKYSNNSQKNSEMCKRPSLLMTLGTSSQGERTLTSNISCVKYLHYISSRIFFFFAIKCDTAIRFE